MELGLLIADRHHCGKYHYGDQSVVRDCCVAYAQQLKEQMDRVALTSYHPAAIAFNYFSQTLTDAEWSQIND